MSDLMLKQFEAWAVIDNRYSIARTYTDLRYDEDDTEAAWDAWQASRETIEVELPDSPGRYYSGAPSAATEDPLECWRDGYKCAAGRIHAAGVKTK